jgi:hypothetical protein
MHMTSAPPLACLSADADASGSTVQGLPAGEEATADRDASVAKSHEGLLEFLVLGTSDRQVIALTRHNEMNIPPVSPWHPRCTESSGAYKNLYCY